jgi:hypothetical protein
VRNENHQDMTLRGVRGVQGDSRIGNGPGVFCLKRGNIEHSTFNFERGASMFKFNGGLEFKLGLSVFYCSNDLPALL